MVMMKAGAAAKCDDRCAGAFKSEIVIGFPTKCQCHVSFFLDGGRICPFVHTTHTHNYDSTPGVSSITFYLKSK